VAAVNDHEIVVGVHLPGERTDRGEDVFPVPGGVVAGRVMAAGGLILRHAQVVADVVPKILESAATLSVSAAPG